MSGPRGMLHAGSSPEWHDLSTGDVDPALLGDDAFFPDFYALGRAMPELDDWVAQGPFLPALALMAARRAGSRIASLMKSARSSGRSA